MSELLEMRHICKSFPGVRALDDVSLTVRAGTVHALMGENGAGKSTLMKCLFGIYSKDSGSVEIDGHSADFTCPRDALLGGVAMVHQELSQALTRSVSDNIFLGRYPTRFGFVRDGTCRRRAREIFDSLGIDIPPDAVLSSLSVSTRQMIEVAKALSYDARVIVLDEPTSSLTFDESERLFAIIDSLKKRGCAVIYISHKMDEILRISDEVTVMRDGRVTATEKASELSTDRIIRLMVGRDLDGHFPARSRRLGDVLLDVCDLSGEANGLHDVSFSALRGEIVGIAGLGGSGRTELLETLFGVARRASGSVAVDGHVLTRGTVRESVRHGMALITEERRRDGIFPILDITSNTVISSLPSYRVRGFLSARRMREVTEEKIRSLRIKTPSVRTKIRTLSGGNQQKVILARWLLTSPCVLLTDEPTRGIDIGAKREIYGLLSALASDGCTVIMSSSEMAELLGLCDRILVMSHGTLAGTLCAAEATEEKIAALASGVKLSELADGAAEHTEGENKCENRK